jgi:hypothetical protein
MVVDAATFEKLNDPRPLSEVRKSWIPKIPSSHLDQRQQPPHIAIILPP